MGLLTVGLVATLLATAGYVGFVTAREFPRVDRILATLPIGEVMRPPAFDRLVLELDRQRYPAWVARSLVAQPGSERPQPAAWHSRNLAWRLVLPLRYREEERLALYAHFLPFEGGSGLAYGARRYFAKSPAELSDEEILQLLVISRSPSLYSPTRNPGRLAGEVRRLREKHGLGVVGDSVDEKT